MKKTFAVFHSHSPGVLPVAASLRTAQRPMTSVRTSTSVPNSLRPECRCVDTECAVTWMTAMCVTVTQITWVPTVPRGSRCRRGVSVPRRWSSLVPPSPFFLVTAFVHCDIASHGFGAGPEIRGFGDTNVAVGICRCRVAYNFRKYQQLCNRL